jgi:hypothetical protein
MEVCGGVGFCEVKSSETSNEKAELKIRVLVKYISS